mmetsp:Transcript_16648/g.42582  ORF Transcript_16648/g.42582 Transcript_16648/m.42582 type:complete len:228 (-) Transcript_16648:1469-2152(-)
MRAQRSTQVAVLQGKRAVQAPPHLLQNGGKVSWRRLRRGRHAPGKHAIKVPVCAHKPRVHDAACSVQRGQAAGRQPSPHPHNHAAVNVDVAPLEDGVGRDNRAVLDKHRPAVPGGRCGVHAAMPRQCSRRRMTRDWAVESVCCRGGTRGVGTRLWPWLEVVGVTAGEGTGHHRQCRRGAVQRAHATPHAKGRVNGREAVRPAHNGAVRAAVAVAALHAPGTVCEGRH